MGYLMRWLLRFSMAKRLSAPKILQFYWHTRTCNSHLTSKHRLCLQRDVGIRCKRVRTFYIFKAMRRQSLNSIIALLLGAILGMISGMLLAPSRGSSLRKVLSYRFRNHVKRLQELIKALSYTQGMASSQAKTAGQEVIDETIEKAKQLLKEANELAIQIEA